MCLKKRREGGIDSCITEEDLELGWLGWILVWHGWPLSWKLFSVDLVEENGTSSEFERGLGDIEWLSSFPIEPKVWNGSNLSLSISFSDESVGNGWGSCLEGGLDTTLNSIEDSSFEEWDKYRCHISPDVSVDMEFQVVPVDIDNNINSIDGRHDASISKRLGSKLDTKSKGDLFKVDLCKSSGDEDELFIAEIFCDKLASDIIAGENKSIVGGINRELDVLWV